jgi:hypothetical protein
MSAVTFACAPRMVAIVEAGARSLLAVPMLKEGKLGRVLIKPVLSARLAECPLRSKSD